MSRIHVLAQSTGNTYAVVVHAPVPNANNSAGVNWRTALVSSGLARTSMVAEESSPGVAAPGRITNAEYAAILAGEVVEAPFSWTDEPGWNNTQRVADLTLRADQAVAATLADLATRLKYYGFVVA